MTYTLETAEVVPVNIPVIPSEPRLSDVTHPYKVIIGESLPLQPSSQTTSLSSTVHFVPHYSRSVKNEHAASEINTLILDSNLNPPVDRDCPALKRSIEGILIEKVRKGKPSNSSVLFTACATCKNRPSCPSAHDVNGNILPGFGIGLNNARSTFQTTLPQTLWRGVTALFFRPNDSELKLRARYNHFAMVINHAQEILKKYRQNRDAADENLRRELDLLNGK